jgi:hypothetical protein
MGKSLLFAIPLLLVAGLAQADTRIGKWKATLDTEEEGAWKVTKEKRQTKLTFSVTARHTSDDDVGKNIEMWCQVERQNEKGEWEWVAGAFYRKTCSVDVPTAIGTYRLHLTNGILSSRAEFTIELHQGLTEG